jgi:hypothetical protein
MNLQRSSCRAYSWNIVLPSRNIARKLFKKLIKIPVYDLLDNSTLAYSNFVCPTLLAEIDKEYHLKSLTAATVKDSSDLLVYWQRDVDLSLMNIRKDIWALPHLDQSSYISSQPPFRRQAIHLEQFVWIQISIMKQRKYSLVTDAVITPEDCYLMFRWVQSKMGWGNVDRSKSNKLQLNSMNLEILKNINWGFLLGWIWYAL